MEYYTKIYYTCIECGIKGDYAIINYDHETKLCGKCSYIEEKNQKNQKESKNNG